MVQMASAELFRSDKVSILQGEVERSTPGQSKNLTELSHFVKFS